MFKELVGSTIDILKADSPKWLMLGGLALTAGGTVSACFATANAKDILAMPQNKELKTMQKIGKVAPLYIPATLLLAGGAACSIGSYKISAERIAVLATAYTLTNDKLEKYQQKVKETLGEKKEEKISQAIADDKAKELDNSLATSSEEDLPIFNTGTGSTVFQDAQTGTIFISDIDAIRKAESRINRRIYREMWVSLNEFYEEFGLAPCGIGSRIGFNTGTELDIQFYPSTSMSLGSPIIIMDYKWTTEFKFGELY